MRTAPDEGAPVLSVHAVGDVSGSALSSPGKLARCMALFEEALGLAMAYNGSHQ